MFTARLLFASVAIITFLDAYRHMGRLGEGYIKLKMAKVGQDGEASRVGGKQALGRGGGENQVSTGGSSGQAASVGGIRGRGLVVLALEIGGRQGPQGGCWGPEGYGRIRGTHMVHVGEAWGGVSPPPLGPRAIFSPQTSPTPR